MISDDSVKTAALLLRRLRRVAYAILRLLVEEQQRRLVARFLAETRLAPPFLRLPVSPSWLKPEEAAFRSGRELVPFAFSHSETIQIRYSQNLALWSGKTEAPGFSH